MASVNINDYKAKSDEAVIEQMRKETAQRIIDRIVWRWIHDENKFDKEEAIELNL
jgi:hypothetical protein